MADFVKYTPFSRAVPFSLMHILMKSGNCYCLKPTEELLIQNRPLIQIGPLEVCYISQITTHQTGKALNLGTLRD